MTVEVVLKLRYSSLEEATEGVMKLANNIPPVSFIGCEIVGANPVLAVRPSDSLFKKKKE